MRRWLLNIRSRWYLWQAERTLAKFRRKGGMIVFSDTRLRVIGKDRKIRVIEFEE